MHKYYVQYVSCIDDEQHFAFISANSEDDIVFKFAEDGHSNVEIFSFDRIEAIYGKMLNPNTKFTPLNEETVYGL